MTTAVGTSAPRWRPRQTEPAASSNPIYESNGFVTARPSTQLSRFSERRDVFYWAS